MHESGLVYVPSFGEVGVFEAQQHNEKHANSQQIKKIAKTIFWMSVAMGLEPVVAEAQQCTEAEQRQSNGWELWMIFMVIFFTLATALICRCFYRLIKNLRKDVDNNQMPLGDHYEYAAWLCERIDNMGWIRGSIENLGYRLDELNKVLSESTSQTREMR